MKLSDQGLAHHLPISAYVFISLLRLYAMSNKTHSPACTALPFILEALDLRLSTSLHRDLRQEQVNGLSEVMRTFGSQHDLTECVTTAVDSILQFSELEIGHMLTIAEMRAAGCCCRWWSG